jgi:hypothetical protein
MPTQSIKDGLLISRRDEYNPNQNVPSDERGTLAISETTGQSVSDYMGFGSYSGSDIKVIVHYPKTTAIRLAIEEERAKVNKDIEENQVSLNNTTDPHEKNRLEEELKGLTSELDTISEETYSLRDLPTSKVLGEVQSVSWSIFREKAPFRSLGSIYPKSYVRGPLTVGGTMIFTLFNKHVLHELLGLNLRMYNTGTSDFDNYKDTTNLIHQLPPLDFSFVFANEYGAVSHMGLWGVDFVQEGGTFSIEDIFSETVVQYVARDIDPIRLAGRRKINNQGVTKAWTDTASDLMLKEQNNYAYRTRRNPFI